MTAKQVLDEYVSFLWTQLQYDWDMFSTPWVLYTIVPALLYLCFFVLKWYVLLAPITIPCTVLKTTSNNKTYHFNKQSE